MEFRVLGPVEIRADDRILDAGHARQRAVLAVLLLDLGHVVPAERLIDRVWGEGPPASVRNVLYGYVARLRSVLASAGDGQATLSRRQGGYRLQAEAEQLDLHRFRSLASQAAAGTDDAAENLLRDALRIWHGSALAGLDSPWLNAMRDTLELERHAAQLDLNEVRLRQGQHAALAAELATQVATAPADERLVGQLMLALYRSGRQAEALRRYHQTRNYLADELGADPAPELRELHQRILRSDPALAVAARDASRRPAAHVPRELPPDVAAFTGRAAELAALDEILLRGPQTTAAVIAALSGTAGVGKTALAVHWAHRVADDFPDGQLHVNLRGYDPGQPVTASEALAGFLRALGVSGQDIPPAEAERATRYRSLLAGRRTLVMLDNAGTVDQIRPLLPGHPHCRVLVTSRDSLAGLVARDGARRLDLDILTLDDAVALLRSLIGERADSDPEAVTELATQCARLPLALRIAAEFAATRPATPLRELVTDLTDEQQRLDLLDVSGDPRTALRTVFSWSYRSLDVHAAMVFRLGGLHPGEDFDLWAVAALAEMTPERARGAVDVLTRAHLMHSATPGRYGMHDLLRAYAREQAGASDSDRQRHQSLTRLFDYYLAVAAAAMDILYPAETERRPRIAPSAAAGATMTSEADAQAWLDRERATLVAVAVYCADQGWPVHCARLASTLYRYLMNGSHLPEAQVLYSHATRAARRSGDAAAEADALNGLGGIGIMHGHYRDAAGHLQAALERYRQSGDRVGQARALANLGVTEYQSHNLQSAAGYYRQAIAAFEDAGHSIGAARALSDLAEAETELGSYDQAEEHLQRALTVHRAAKEQFSEADALKKLGKLSLCRGDLTPAGDFYRQALAIFQRIDHPVGVAAQLRSLGEVSYRQGEYQEAVSHLRHALELDVKTGFQHGEILALRALAPALHALGQTAAARAELTAALRLAAQTGNTYQLASTHSDLAESHQSAAEVDQARHHWQQALALFAELGADEADPIRAQLAALDNDETVSA